MRNQELNGKIIKKLISYNTEHHLRVKNRETWTFRRDFFLILIKFQITKNS